MFFESRDIDAEEKVRVEKRDEKAQTHYRKPFTFFGDVENRERTRSGHYNRKAKFWTKQSPRKT
jgi:hypothetical protein